MFCPPLGALPLKRRKCAAAGLLCTPPAPAAPERLPPLMVRDTEPTLALRTPFFCTEQRPCTVRKMNQRDKACEKSSYRDVAQRRDRNFPTQESLTGLRAELAMLSLIRSATRVCTSLISARFAGFTASAYSE